MKEINEIFGCGITIEESKDKGIVAKIKFPFGIADKENKNKRTYPLEIFSNAVKNLGEKIKSAFVPGQTDHPLMGGGTRLSEVSHILTKVWMEGKKAWASANILDTTKGTNVLKVLKSGVQMGSSLRGSGEIGSDGKVKKGLRIDSVDLVASPSFGKDAEVGVGNLVIESTIIEKGIGVLSNEEKRHAGYYNPRATITEEKIEKRSKVDSNHFAEYTRAGGRLNFKDWKKERE